MLKQDMIIMVGVQIEKQVRNLYSTIAALKVGRRLVKPADNDTTFAKQVWARLPELYQCEVFDTEKPTGLSGHS
eukprot:2778869-Karenia_brevis.AAC.1